MRDRLSYAIVTPARNEAANLTRLGACPTEQSQLPDKWVIVDNGSTDETFSALITRLITTNRAERAIREKASKAGPTLHRSDQREADPSDSLRA